MAISFELIVNLLFSLTIFFFLLLIYFLLRSGGRRKMVLSEADYYLLDAQKKAAEIVGRAGQEAEKIRSRAEIEENALVARLRTETKKNQEEYQKRLDQIFNESQKEVTGKILATETSYNGFLNFLRKKADGAAEAEKKILGVLKEEVEKVRREHEKTLTEIFEKIKTESTQKMGTTQSAYADYIKSLEERIVADLNENRTVLREKTDQLFSQSLELLQKFIGDLQSSTQTQLDAEIGNARKIVDEYRRQRLEIIDENIVAILEKTLNIALGKVLTLGEQTELVYEALERAKKENIFD